MSAVCTVLYWFGNDDWASWLAGALGGFGARAHVCVMMTSLGKMERDADMS